MPKTEFKISKGRWQAIMSGGRDFMDAMLKAAPAGNFDTAEFVAGSAIAFAHVVKAQGLSLDETTNLWNEYVARASAEIAAEDKTK